MYYVKVLSLTTDLLPNRHPEWDGLSTTTRAAIRKVCTLHRCSEFIADMTVLAGLGGRSCAAVGAQEGRVRAVQGVGGEHGC